MTIKEIKQEIKELENIKNDYYTKIVSLKLQLEKLELPLLEKKYVGKCYVCTNSCGKDHPKWLLYTKIVGVSSNGDLQTNSFEVVLSKDWEFRVREVGTYIIEGRKEIKLEVYEKALKEFKEGIS